jgi:hypothetical protein
LTVGALIAPWAELIAISYPIDPSRTSLSTRPANERPAALASHDEPGAPRRRPPFVQLVRFLIAS